MVSEAEEILRFSHNNLFWWSIVTMFSFHKRREIWILL